MAATARKQVNPKRTNLSLETEAGEHFELWEYPFPETRGERFSLFLNGTRTEAARTEGKGYSKPPAVRHYTYIKYRGQSLYVAVRLPEGSRVRVREH